MDDSYWSQINSLIEPLQFTLKQESTVNYNHFTNGTQNLSNSFQLSTDQSLSSLHYPPSGLSNQMSDSLEERIKNSLADIDEERVLNCLSSPEPELEELLFPELVHQHAQQPNVQQTLSFAAEPRIQQTTQPANVPIQNNTQSGHTPTAQQKRPRESASSNTTKPNVSSPEAIEVVLLHKPRGCKGIWQKVTSGEPLRVTKGKGKWLKVEIKSSHEIKAADTDIFLVDASLSNNTHKLTHTEDEGITIESKAESNTLGVYLVEIELKLDRVCKKLHVWAVSKSRGTPLKGKSVEFAAHNNGKANNAKPIKEEPESVSEGFSSSSSSASGGNSSSGSDYKETVVKKKRRQDPVYDEEPSSIVPGSLKVNGVVRAKAFLQYSDLRLKANVTDLVDAVNIVSQLKGRTFTWKQNQLDPSGGKRVIGLIAQEVKRVIPEVVHETENGFLSVAYAEIVPILIEAFKEQMKQYNTDKEEVRLQLQVLESKLDVISRVLEKDQLESMTQLQLQQQQQQLLEMQHQQQILQQQIQQQQIQQQQQLQQQQQQQIVIPAPLKGLLFNLSTSEPEPKKENAYKQNILRMSVVVTFILGLLTITLGAILLGMTLSSPEQFITTSVIQARDLKPMDRDGSPDSYCEVSIGSQLFRTQTIWNSNHPLFEEIFSTPAESSVTKIYYQMYDDDANPYFPPRRMGVATFDMTDIKQDQTYTEWLTLVPNIEGDEVSGQIQISLYVSKPQKPGYELLLLFAGVFLTSVSIGLGYYVWRSGKNADKLAHQFVQMQTKMWQ